jgi:hypothetical protein
VVLVVLVAAGVWVARDRGWGEAAVRALWPASGCMAAAVVLAVVAGLRGLDPGHSYYAAKLAEAATIAALPVGCALLTAAVVPATERWAATWRVWVRVVAVALIAILAGLLPVGRGEGTLAGPGLLARRFVEAGRASGQVHITDAAERAGASAGEASAMMTPSGWFGKVAFDDAPAEVWVREAVSASLWLATLRGIRTHAMDEAAACMTGAGGPGALACLAAWLDAAAGRRVVLVTGPGPDRTAAREWARHREPGQVRLVELPAPE